MCWASLMAGGSCAAIPVTDHAFLYELSQMSPVTCEQGMYLLKGTNGYIVYAESGQTNLNVGNQHYKMFSVDAKTGKIVLLNDVSGVVSFPGKGVFWLSKNQ
jgi:hypothetical protein